MDDSMIVELYLSRDESAIKHTSEKFGARLRSLSHNIVGDLQAAEECENDTYIEAWNTIPRTSRSIISLLSLHVSHGIFL